MLRYQPAIGPSLDTPGHALPVAAGACPTYLGFDPRLQLVHERDAVDALAAAVARPVRGRGERRRAAARSASRA